VIKDTCTHLLLCALGNTEGCGGWAAKWGCPCFSGRVSTNCA